MSIYKSILFVIIFCFIGTEIFAQNNPTLDRPDPLSPTNPVISPTPPLPPQSTPSARPGDSTLIQAPVSPNQPSPSTITPANPFPKSQVDTVFRNIDDSKSPFGSDSVPSPKNK
jgi:hypothetical protein